jgi:hypothetical protein
MPSVCCSLRSPPPPIQIATAVIANGRRIMFETVGTVMVSRHTDTRSHVA